jgi:hypothetical protein
MRFRSLAGGFFVIVAALLAASLAFAAEQTRETYKAEVEPICKANVDASGRILKGVKGEVKAGKLQVAAGQFSKAAAALKKTLNQLRAVEPPPADSAKISKWLGYVKTEVELFEKTAAKLKAGKKAAAQEMAVRLTSTVNQANNQVLAFEFKYCKANASQYT